MRIRPGSPLLSFACVALAVATWSAAPRMVVAQDPRIDGLIPHALPDPDPNILSSQSSVKLPGVHPYTPPALPTPTASTASAPSAIPATGPEAEPASAPASSPATAPEAATTSAPASGTAPAAAPN
jgi:hypothetical protein